MPEYIKLAIIKIVKIQDITSKYLYAKPANFGDLVIILPVSEDFIL